ncbi:MAG: hypothetical protein K0U72_16610 [Gammaproteobacteria bacterium]|nr:hypothetical protein [Gammaproteobacteria bacterium]
MAVAMPCATFAAPGDVLFSDDFEDGTLPAWTTTNNGISGVSNTAGWFGSGSFGAYTSNQVVVVTSPSFNAAVPEARLRLWVRRGADSFSEDTDDGEDFIIEYRRANNTWGPLSSYLGSGTNGQVYNESLVLPADARHGNLAIRVRQTGGSGTTYDFWHFDNVIVDEIAVAPGLSVGTCDDFENGLSTNWTVNPGSGFAGISSATSQSPSNSMFLNGGIVDVTSNAIDTTDITFSDLSIWVRRGADSFSEDPDNGENLVVEYLNDSSAWVSLETFSGSGGQGQQFVRSYTIPAAGKHTGFRIRFRMTGGSGSIWDFWHVDDVCLDQDPDPILQVTKLSTTLSDPVNGSSGPKAIPGAFVQYTVGLVNQGIGSVDADSMVITDPIPANTSLYVSTVSGDPVSFVDGAISSGLSYSYPADIEFSIQPGGGAPYGYTPVPDAQGFDSAITGYRITPGGAMNGDTGSGAPSFNIVFRVRIE